MSKGSLARLEEVVQGAIAHELGESQEDVESLDELGIAPARTRIISGVTVVSNAARDADIDENAGKLIDRLLRYLADRGLVTKKLKRVGIEPIAVLPIKTWNCVCDSMHLYRCTPRGDLVRFTAPQAIDQEAQRLATEEYTRELADVSKWHILVAILFVLFAIASIVFCFVYSGWWFFGIVAGVIAAFVAAGSGTEPESIYSRKQSHIRALVKDYEQKGTLIEALWPGFHEPNEGTDVKISLPVPSPEMQDELIAAQRARLPLRIAAPSRAFSFKQSVGDLLVGKGSETWLPPSKSNASPLDPIAYVIEGTAVAIVAQYGDFPLDPDVIKQVVNSEHLV
jgi:hypothetical protein